MKRLTMHSEAFFRVASPLCVGALLLLIWELTCRFADIPIYLFPKPSEIFQKLAGDGPALLSALWVTLLIALEAFAAAVVFGSLIAFLFVQSRFIEISF